LPQSLPKGDRFLGLLEQLWVDRAFPRQGENVLSLQVNCYVL
jgi:hypothetical protein